MSNLTLDSPALCCGQKTKVVDSRTPTGTITRRRKCLVCGAKASTVEIMFSSLKDAGLEKVGYDVNLLVGLSGKQRLALRHFLETLQ